ncbi:MAG: hypothetical protein ACP5D2_02095 [Candidatus Nanoarchaeia archaeon]
MGKNKKPKKKTVKNLKLKLGEERALDFIRRHWDKPNFGKEDD